MLPLDARKEPGSSASAVVRPGVCSRSCPFFSKNLSVRQIMIKLKSAIDRRLPDSQIRTDRPNGLKFRDGVFPLAEAVQAAAISNIWRYPV